MPEFASKRFSAPFDHTNHMVHLGIASHLFANSYHKRCLNAMSCLSKLGSQGAKAEGLINNLKMKRVSLSVKNSLFSFQFSLW